MYWRGGAGIETFADTGTGLDQAGAALRGMANAVAARRALNVCKVWGISVSAHAPGPEFRAYALGFGAAGVEDGAKISFARVHGGFNLIRIEVDQPL